MNSYDNGTGEAQIPKKQGKVIPLTREEAISQFRHAQTITDESTRLHLWYGTRLHVLELFFSEDEILEMVYEADSDGGVRRKEIAVKYMVAFTGILDKIDCLTRNIQEATTEDR